MNSFPKASIVLAIVIATFDSHVANPQSTSSRSELQVVLRVVPNGDSIPALEVELANTGGHDLILNLGYIVNGRGQFASAIHLSLRNTQNNARILDLKGPPFIAGRVDAFVVPLPKGARIVFPLNLTDFADYSNEKNVVDAQFKPGRYLLSAEYRGERVEHANLDCKGIVAMPYWLGRVDSNETSFVVPGK